VSIIAFLLLAPLLRTLTRSIEKPVVVIIQDNSESVKLNRDSAFYQNEYPQLLNQLTNALAEDFEVRRYLFGKSLSDTGTLNFQEKQTDIDLALKEAINLYSGRNIGAFVLATDGIYNKGANPFSSAG
jgi:hypothetical protein